MSQPLKYKIEATDTSFSKLLKEQKFLIDNFQREYRWEEKHIVTLVEDLTNTFLALNSNNYRMVVLFNQYSILYYNQLKAEINIKMTYVTRLSPNFRSAFNSFKPRSQTIN